MDGIVVLSYWRKQVLLDELPKSSLLKVKVEMMRQNKVIKRSPEIKVAQRPLET